MKRATPPTRLVRMAAGTPNIDLEQRTIESVITTRAIARDGGVVLPRGIDTRHFEANPVVQARHGHGAGPKAMVVGRSLGLSRTERGMSSITQFANTELGREYAYLYGVNEEQEVFMRAWSFGWMPLELDYWNLAQARLNLGEDFDEAVLSTFDLRHDEVWVSVRSEMHEYSAVEVGADRGALSRAWNNGVRVAGELVAQLDLRNAETELAKLRSNQEELAGQVDRLQQDMQALRRDGAAAVTRGDTAELLERITRMAELVKGTS